jgi:hypothetical protein
VIALVAVPAVLIGLLAMHVLATTGASDVSSSATIAMHHSSEGASHDAAAMAASPALPSPADDCGQTCPPSHDMLTMICVLALMVTLVFVTFLLIRTRWDDRGLSSLLQREPTGFVKALAPPSLHVLSISRT